MKRQLLLILLIVLMILSACEPNSNQDHMITYRFETDGGSSISDININIDEHLSLPSNPTKEGYQFIGWYLDHPDFNVPYEKDQVSNYLVDTDIILYAKWEQIEIYYEITWKMPDGRVLKTDSVLENTLPSYDGITPHLNPTDQETYTFTGWSPDVTNATQDQIYIATFETHIIEPPTFNPSDLNDLFGFDIYQSMPEITTDVYEIFDFSEGAYKEVYIDVFTWDEQDSIDYMDLLDLHLPYDEQEASWILNDYYIFVYEDTFSYPNSTVYGIGIYGDGSHEITYDDFESMINEAATYFNEEALNRLIPNFTPLDQLSLLTQAPTRLEFSGLYTGSESETDITNWSNLMTINGFVYHQSLSNIQGQSVYAYEIHSDLSYAVILDIIDDEFYFSIWSFDPTIELNTLEQLDYMQSINEYEYARFSDSGLPSKGTFDVLVIPIEFSERPFPSNYLENLDLVFNGTPEETGWHSVSSYYSQSSYGLLNMSFDIVEKYDSKLTQAFIESKAGDGDQYVIYEALMDLDPTIDFSKYDTNQDGLIDSIYFIYSVYYDYDVEPWWAWVYAAYHGEASSLPKLDGLGFEYYAWISYAFMYNQIDYSDGQVVNAETFIHETGHLFGGVDLYSYSGDYNPFGSLGMMDYTSGDHDPIHKLLFGWTRPYLASTGTYEVTLESYTKDLDGMGSTVVIPYSTKTLRDGDAFDEFVIIMFYTPNGLYEEHLGLPYVLDDAGLIIYHVDARLNQYTRFLYDYFTYNNNGRSDFFARVLEVDNNNSLSDGSLSMDDILSSGYTNLSNYEWHQGGAIDIQIEVLSIITNDSDEVTFRLTVK